MKKLMAILVAAAMVLTMALCVSAEDTVLYEGSVTLKADGTWPLISSDATVPHNHGGQSLEGFDGIWEDITHVVFTCEQGNFIMAFRQKDGAWNQTATAEANTYDIVFADKNVMTVADGTMKDDNSAEAIPEMMVAVDAADGADYVIKYTIYGAAAETAETAETTEAAETTEEAAETTEEAAETTEEAEATAETTTTETTETTAAAETTTETKAPATGIALAVVPAVVALAAASLSKKH